MNIIWHDPDFKIESLPIDWSMTNIFFLGHRSSVLYPEYLDYSQDFWCLIALVEFIMDSSHLNEMNLLYLLNNFW